MIGTENKNYIFIIVSIIKRKIYFSFYNGTSYSVNWYKLNNLYFEKECEEYFNNVSFSTWNIKYF